MPAKYKQVLKLFSHIQNFLIDTLKDLGADPQVKDVVRVLRVPTSTNTKTGEAVRILNYSKKFYTMRCLQQFMNEALMIDLEAVQKPSPKQKKGRKVKSIYIIILRSLWHALATLKRYVSYVTTRLKAIAMHLSMCMRIKCSSYIIIITLRGTSRWTLTKHFRRLYLSQKSKPL